ncbi:hypothetical protein [Arenibaculum pallidiluteum]|uniref:hypothetical protein n=1 Tax=Arenibaculum pallidiluteum TaxID=2812559 RepID=UPI001A96EA04|nr:hypothetical protein [Arenibaculum pallidiluteum]
MQLISLFQWIEAAPAVRLIVVVPWLYPTISALHILGVGILIGSIASVDLRLLRILGPKFDPVLPTLIRLAMIGFAIAVATGLLLVSVRIGNYVRDPAFLAKVLILLAAGGNAVALHIASRPESVASMVGRARGRVAAILSLGLWLCAVFAGRWIAFA